MPITTVPLRTRRGAAFATLVSAVLVALTAASARADAPTLDPAFGSAGVSLQARPHDATIDALLPLPGGGFLAAGKETTVGFLLARYRADGTLDPGFGSGGVTTTAIGSNGSATAGSLALQGDKIVLAGTSWDGSSQPVATVARYTAAGQLDTTFAGGVGWAQIPSAYSRFGSALAIAADNRILVGGAKNGSVVMRLGADSGTLDPSFGGSGAVGIPGNLGGCSDDASSGVMGLQIVPQGIVAGMLCGGKNGVVASTGIARFTSAGALDPAFGTGGVSTYRAAPSTPTFGIGPVPTAGGGFVMALQFGLGGPPNTLAALRWTGTGVLDPGFGSGGIGAAFTFTASSTANAVAVDGSDRVLVAGSQAAMNPTGGFGVMRLTAAGTLDPLWNTAAPFFVAIGDGQTYPTAVAVQGDGKILVAGMAQQGGVGVLALARLIAPPEPTVAPLAVPPVVAPPVTPPVTPPPAKKPRFADVVRLPSSKRCLSRRSLRIRLRTPKGAKLRSATVTVNGHRVKTVKGKRLRVPVDLRGLPRGRYTVRITVRLTNGTVLRGSRRYRTCAPRHKARHRAHHRRSV